jgi:hypothetical protein
METNRIKVKSEFAPLKKVVLTQSEFIFPARTGNSIDDAFLSEDLKGHSEKGGFTICNNSSYSH